MSKRNIYGKYSLLLVEIILLFYVMGKYAENNFFYAALSGANVLSFLILCHTIQKYLVFDYWQEYVLIFFCLLFSVFPFCINDFFYYDDLWSFSDPGISMVGIALQRPFIDLYANVMSPLEYGRTSFFRILLMIVQYFFAISFYTYLREKSIGRLMGVFFSVFISCNVLVVDFLGYLSIFPVILSNLYIFYAYNSWRKYLNEKVRSKFFRGVVLFISGCMHYPIIAPVIFGFILIDVVFEHMSKIKVLYHMLMYGVGMLLYLLLTKSILALFDMPISKRAMVVSSYEGALFKLNWFIFDVVPSTLNHFLTCFSSNLSTKYNCMFYTIEFNNGVITNVLCVIFISSVAFVCYKFYREKQYFFCFYVLGSMPLSFMFWLILDESTILTYYTYPLFFSIGIIFFIAVWYVLRSCNLRTMYSRNVIIVLILSIIVSSNVYASNFWVKYNSSGYEFIRNTISANINDNIKHIHIYGKLNPMQINTYAVMATKLILRDMNLSYDDYKITASDNDAILSGMTCDEKERLYSNLSEEQKKVFDDNYIPNEKYPVYYLKPKERAANDFIAIKAMLISGGALPEKNDSTIIVDLNKGFVKFNQF